MSLDFERLENFRQCAGGYRAACPACRENGSDKKGNHLFIPENGRFGCAKFQGDHEHRARIFQLAGLPVENAGEIPASRTRSVRKGRGQSPATRAAGLRERASKNLTEIVGRYRSDRWRKEFEERSPVPLNGPPYDDWSVMLGTLFHPDDVLFVGEPTDSGKFRGQGHFRPAKEWLRFPELPHSRVAAATFEEGTVNRSKACIVSQPFVILESDELIGKKPQTLLEGEANKEATAALFHWLVEELHMHLVAVIDTGNKSLHGWFSYPMARGFMDELQQIASGLRLDLSLLRQPNAPVRLPGALHEKTKIPAQLLYLDHPRVLTNSGKP